MDTLAPNGVRPTRDEAGESQLIDGKRLLEVLFAENCRPTLRWLRDQQKSRRIPFVKIGRLVFFNPAHVRVALEQPAR